MKLLLTGATGFVGRAVLDQLLTVDSRVYLSASVRSDYASLPVNTFCVGELSGDTDWSEALQDKEVIIHCAGRAHITKDEIADPLTEYRRVNVQGTLNLAEEAASRRVRRFIFISSVGVNGNVNTEPFTEDDHPKPADHYAQSKWEAEQGLWQIQRKTGMEVVIIRPPLVYGPGAPGNFGALVRWVARGIPLPLGAINNKRSLVAMDNLVDLIITCIDHPAAANELFLAGDGQDLSTTELLRGVAHAMAKPARLIPVPAGLLTFGASMLGKRAVAQRLLGSLQVDISKARDVLGWQPPVSVQEGLARAVKKG